MAFSSAQRRRNSRFRLQRLFSTLLEANLSFGILRCAIGILQTQTEIIDLNALKSIVITSNYNYNLATTVFFRLFDLRSIRYTARLFRRKREQNYFHDQLLHDRRKKIYSDLSETGGGNGLRRPIPVRNYRLAIGKTLSTLTSRVYLSPV